MQTTQLSLIQRLQNADDNEAWQAFAEIYFPAIVHSLRFKGLAIEDSEDVAQQVMVSVASSLAKRPHDPERARFRTWLERVIRNAAINAIQRCPKDRATGGTDILAVLTSMPQADADAALLEREHRKQLLRVAARRIECEFAADTWQAFWRTAVLGETIETVAQQLGKQVGSVYAARSRVMRRLRAEIEEFDSASMDDPSSASDG